MKTTGRGSAPGSVTPMPTTAPSSTLEARSIEPPDPTGSSDDDADRRSRIALAAYLKAQQRDFLGGSEVEDWLAAEKEVDAQRIPSK